ncbi:cysteine proteinase inhibitor 6-like [Macadamia integrifolia]|uniref:cysteine proteinase inhibitor 6-like n=1 Tax=Macadamia integrifolia TaxID=60698 RepID=UPI001C4F07E2|nr:cysteine proteinase inhibitor 6-like [Macadamia integrifolia]
MKVCSVLVLSIVVFFSAFCEFVSCGDDNLIRMATLGGVREVEGFQNSIEIDELGRFAVDEHNKKENKILEFAGVVKAKEQVVAGTLHHLTLEVVEAGKKKIYEAKVWVKPWMNFKELQDFKPASGSPSFTSSDLGAKQDGHKPGWRAVPAHDPIVQDAANHAVKTIQQRSNSLAPYELLEVLLAKSEVIDEVAKLNLLLKLKRGSKEEKFNVEVHKTVEGSFHLNHMQQDCT